MIPRCAFFFENPNMAAVLFVQIALVGRILGLRRPRLGGVLTFAAALAVVLTGSRGGLVALAVGLAVFAFAAGRPPRASAVRRRTVVGVGVVAIALAFVLGGLGARMCAIPRDGSVHNRLLLWRAVPRMMAEAPDGWGFGNAGRAFVDWYQPLDRHEQYRTLVGSHQTWLVEFGTAGRFLYLFGWLLVLAAAFRHARKTGETHAVAQWTALAVAATFSSVLEQVVLWAAPVWTLGRLAVRQSRCLMSLPLASGAAVVAAVSVLAVNLLAGVGSRFVPEEGRAFWAGPEGLSSARWLVPDEKVLGTHYPRRLRAAGRSIAVAQALDQVGSDAEEIVICGAARPVSRSRFPKLKRVTYLSPRFRPLVVDASFERVFVGEFAERLPDPLPDGVTCVVGAADYLETGTIGFW